MLCAELQGRAGRGLLVARGLAPHGAAGTIPSLWNPGGKLGLLSREAAGRRPGRRTHSDRRTPKARGPLLRDALGKSSPACAGWGTRLGAPRWFFELWGALSRPPETLQTPPFRVGVRPSGGACLRLGVFPCACCCACGCLLFVCLCAFPLCVIASVDVSSSLGPCVFAVGVGVCERPLQELCLSSAVSASFCLYFWLVYVSPLGVFVSMSVCVCDLSVSLFSSHCCL